MKVGLISDTHGLLRPEAIEALAGVDHILHAGDIGARGIIPRLREVAPVSAIRGNVDIDDWASEFPERLDLRLAGQRVHIVHDLAALSFDPVELGYSVIVFGHSHRSSIETEDGVLRINPGSAGPRRFRLPVTLGYVTLTGDGPANPEIRHLVP
jgi:uncharacterized protein